MLVTLVPMRRDQGMPAPLTSHQRNLFMTKRRGGSSQEAAAAAAGISVRSARRIECNQLQPRANQPRGRTRPDPLVGVWEEELVPLLQRSPALTPITLLEHLQRQKQDVDWIPLRRTLQRRVREWKAMHGPAPEVIFPLSYEPGEIAFCDFTQLKGVEVTIAGEAFPHLLFHYRLAWSGWSYAQVVQGGESFVALSEGLQNALAACGGVPAELRTDRLSAACRNRNGSFSADITPRYHALCSHYGLAYSRNNCGVAHENGRVESPHGHLKRRIEQALLLRSSSDFESLAEYQAFLAAVLEQYNRPRLVRLEQEKSALRPLPRFRFADYDIEQLTVRRTSTIEVRRVVYSVPPRLIDQRLTVRIFHDRLQLLLGRQIACELARRHGGVERHGRAWSIDLEHLIDALRRKPRALLHCSYQRELFPDERWWQLWQQLRNGGDRDAAARLMVEALYVGCRLAGYEPVLVWLEKAHQRQGLSLAALQQRFRLPPHRPHPPQRISQHTLQSYDDLLALHPAAPGGGSRPADPAATAAVGMDPLPLAEHRLAG
ncbi:IS21 family transposase [Synechococcus sp. CBW1108]|uniref:IS21 family transposase n=1 Tax=Synechococcus sp. CBW1108 TaxID=1353147 RepID=UPI001E312AB3|nr:IS21 family transposase [Synechococcus sp. CBW1108]